MKIIMTKKLYPKLGIVNGSIKYKKKKSFTNVKWIQKTL
jgi:hypothetical protein